MTAIPSPETLVIFVGAAVALILTPGPDTLFVLAAGMRNRAVGVRSALGVSTGVLLHTTAAVLGLSVLLRTVPAAYTGVKLVGAAYLAYLGVQTLRGDGVADAGTPREDDAAGATTADAGASDPTDAESGGYRQGVLVNALNPKVALFFLAFLPGFASGPDAGAEIAVLGGTYAVLTALYLSGVALLSNRAGRLFGGGRASDGLRWVAGSVFLALGASLALDSR